MHNAAWQAVCGFFTDIYETLNREDVSMRHIFEEICRHDREVYALWSENGKKRQLTYGEMMGLCAGTAQKIDMSVADKSGVIALHMPNCAMWPVVFWAILMTGHTPLLLNAALPLKNFEPLLEKIGAVAVISVDADSGAIDPKCLVNDSSQADIALFENRWADRLIFMTSGTSGLPKLVVFNGKGMAKQIQSCRYFYRETTEISYPKNMGSLKQLALLPFSHVFGFIICVMWYPFMGKQIVYTPSLRPDEVINTCQKMHVTHLCAVPSYYDMIIQIMINAAKGLFGKHADGYIAYLKEGRLNAPELYQRYMAYSKKLCGYTLGGDVRYLISGGGMLSGATAAFFNRMGLYFSNGYGMTELGILAVEKSQIPEKRMQASIGCPSYGVDFSIDEKGELWADCDFAAVGYLESEGLVPLEKPFSTKDLARKLPDGRYMLLGRSDDIIIDSDGNRIHPAEIEERMRRIPGITGMCVVYLDKKLTALIEVSRVSDLTQISEGINRLNRNAPLSHFIHKCMIVKNLARTAKGEVNRKEMAALCRAGLEGAQELSISPNTEHTGLETEMLFTIRRKTAELLSVDPETIMPDANFFTELGMDSLTYMCLIQWLEEEYRIPFASLDGQRFESVSQLAEFIQMRGRDLK